MTDEERKHKLLLWADIKHFTYDEFNDPSIADSGLNMNIEFIKILDAIRDNCGFPIHVNSGWRSADHNADVGGKIDSAHTEDPGMASDLEAVSSTTRFQIIAEAIKLGIKRIGIGETFVHLDMSFTLPQLVMWLYPRKATATNQSPKGDS